jgi:hypothetical protein
MGTAYSRSLASVNRWVASGGTPSRMPSRPPLLLYASCHPNFANPIRHRRYQVLGCCHNPSLLPIWWWVSSGRFSPHPVNSTVWRFRPNQWPPIDRSFSLVWRKLPLVDCVSLSRKKKFLVLGNLFCEVDRSDYLRALLHLHSVSKTLGAMPYPHVSLMLVFMSQFLSQFLRPNFFRSVYLETWSSVVFIISLAPP